MDNTGDCHSFPEKSNTSRLDPIVKCIDSQGTNIEANLVPVFISGREGICRRACKTEENPSFPNNTRQSILAVG